MNDENEKEILRRELNDKELLSSDSGKFDPGNFDAHKDPSKRIRLRQIFQYKSEADVSIIVGVGNVTSVWVRVEVRALQTNLMTSASLSGVSVCAGEVSIVMFNAGAQNLDWTYSFMYIAICVYGYCPIFLVICLRLNSR